MDHRLVVERVEVGTHRLDDFHAALAKQFEHLLMNEFNTLAEAFDILTGRRFQRTFEIIDDWQQAGQCAGRRGICLIASIPIDALAIVVELRRLADEAVVVLVAFALEGLDLGRFG